MCSQGAGGGTVGSLEEIKGEIIRKAFMGKNRIQPTVKIINNKWVFFKHINPLIHIHRRKDGTVVICF